MSVYRTLSPVEVLYLMCNTDRHSPFINQFIVEGTGLLDPQQWQQAIHKAALANSTIRLQLKGFWGWRYWDDQGPLPKLQVIDACDWDAMNSAGADFLNKPMDPRKNPVAEVILLNTNKPKIVFRTHHAITDGAGTLHWIEEIFRALRNEPLKGSVTAPTEWQLAQSMKIPKRVVKGGNSIPVLSENNNDVDLSYHWQRLKWHGNQSSIVAKIIIALATLAREQRQGRFFVRIPANVRRYSKQKEFNMTNCSGIIDLEVTEQDTVQTIQSKIMTAMLKKQDLSFFASPLPHLFKWLPKIAFPMPVGALKRLHKKGRYLFSANLSNVGRINLEKLCYQDFTATDGFATPIALENRPICSVITQTSDSINATIGTPSALATPEQLHDFCQTFAKLLDQL